MSNVRASHVVAAAAFSIALCCGSHPSAAVKPPPGAAPFPADVQIELTDMAGWVYADKQGHTLYTWPYTATGPGQTAGGDRVGKPSSCTDERIIRVMTNVSNMQYYLPDADKRPTCVKFTPPLLAAPDAK